MLYSTLPNGLKISKIGLGTLQFGVNYGFDRCRTQSEVDAILSFCEDHGINFLDTARAYGESEQKIGNFIQRHPNHHFVLATKLKPITQEIAQKKETLWNHMDESIETSLKLLNVKRVSLLLLHQTSDFVLNNDFFWEKIRTLKEKQIMDFFGVSVYEVPELQNIIQNHHDSVKFVLLPLNVFDQRFSETTYRLKEKGMFAVGRSIFLKGVITANDEDIPEEIKDILPLKGKFKSASENLGFSVNELALLYGLNQDGMASTLIGISEPQELMNNIQVLNRFKEFQSLRYDFGVHHISNRFLTDPRQWKQL